MAIAGTGHRGVTMFGTLLTSPEAHGAAQLVGLFDRNELRARAAQQLLRTEAPVFVSLEDMVSATGCDTVIVTTMDSTHADVIVRALNLGCDVITEKPLTIDEVSLTRILEAERDTGKQLSVAFNYRYMPFATAIKELLRSDRLGRITSVDFHWYLDTVHGVDYFRRWHRRRQNSGSLWVHKATHHFDLVDWWLEQEPVEVFAKGSLSFYGEHGARHGERCGTCNVRDSCPFAFEWSTTNIELYRNTETGDGYWRDACVFASDIDIWDTMTALVTYNRGVLMSYSLVAYAPYEGYRIAFNGTRGRLECEYIEAVVPDVEPRFAPRMQVRRPPDATDRRSAASITFYPLFGGIETIEPPEAGGEHGGGDRRLGDAILHPHRPDPLGHRATSRAGAMSILTGIAATRSIDTNAPVSIRRLVPDHLLP